MNDPSPTPVVEEFVVPHWRKFVEIAETVDIGDPLSHTYIFRGEEDASWPLVHSLRRAITNDGATPLPSEEELLRVERVLVSKFRATASTHLPSAAIATSHAQLDWWTLMRHYGVPTRTIDWTGSIFVAAYFACSRCPEKDGGIYCLHTATLNKAMAKTHGEKETTLASTVDGSDAAFCRPGAPSVIFVVSKGSGLLDRMIVQQGVFMVCRNIIADLGQTIATDIGKVAPVDREIFTKIRIPAAQKRMFVRRLRAMNITASSLFPGLDGIGRHLDELTRNLLA